MLRAEKFIKCQGHFLIVKTAFKIQDPALYGHMVSAYGGTVADVGHSGVSVALRGGCGAGINAVFRQLHILRDIQICGGNTDGMSQTSAGDHITGKNVRVT